MVNHDITRRNHRRGGGAGLAGVTLLTAAVIGAVHTARPAQVGLLTTAVDLLAAPSDATDLLDRTVANFNTAGETLGQVDLTAHPAFGSFIDAQLSTQNLVVSSILGLQHAQETISANDAPLQFLVDPAFFLLNLGWYLNSEATLSLAQGINTALANDLWPVAGLAELGMYVLDFQAFGGALAGFPILFASAFF